MEQYSSGNKAYEFNINTYQDIRFGNECATSYQQGTFTRLTVQPVSSQESSLGTDGSQNEYHKR